jgi:hypothetical protein
MLAVSWMALPGGRERNISDLRIGEAVARSLERPADPEIVHKC